MPLPRQNTWRARLDGNDAAIAVVMAMSLNFPNASRSFEATQNRVRFWGYDSAIEITFFIQAECLMEICSGVGETEAELLAAFDSAIERIHQAAINAYGRGRKRSYVHTLAMQDL